MLTSPSDFSFNRIHFSFIKVIIPNLLFVHISNPEFLILALDYFRIKFSHLFGVNLLCLVYLYCLSLFHQFHQVYYKIKLLQLRCGIQDLNYHLQTLLVD